MGKLNVPGVVIAALLAALGSVFYSPAVSTLMIDIIPNDDMIRGQAIFSGANSMVNMVGTVLYGVLGDVFPLYLVFVIGSAISLIPMLYMCFHPRTREFVLKH